MGALYLKAEECASGLSCGKAGGKCVHLGLHIKRQADGPEGVLPSDSLSWLQT